MTDIPDEAKYPEWREPIRKNMRVYLTAAEPYLAPLWTEWAELMAENARLRSQVEAAEKELAIANRVIRRHLPELVEAVRAEVAALSDEGKPDE